MATGLENSQIIGIDHPALAAQDVDNLADWYCNVLGFTKYFRAQKPVCRLLAPDKTLLKIMPKDDTGRPVRTTWTPGWSHVALRVADLEKAITYLNTKKVQWRCEIMQAYGGGRVRNLYDLEENMLQLVERSFN